MNIFQNEEDVDRVINAATDIGATLVVIDPLGVATAGADDNNFRDVSVYMSRIQRIAKETGAHVCLVAHPGKNPEAGIRGSYHHFATADVVIDLQADKVTKLVRTATVTKSRDNQIGDQFNFRLEAFEIGADVEGELITSLIVRECDHIGSVKQQPNLTGKQRQRYEFVRDLFADPNLTHEVSPNHGMKREKCVRRADCVAAMEKKGWITREPNNTLSDKERRKIADILDALEGKGLLCANSEWIWLTR